MKAKKVIALAMVMVLVLAMSSVALAIPSPTGATVTGTSANVTNVEVKPIAPAKQETMVKTAATEILAKHGSDYQVDTLLAMDLVVTRTDDKPATISLNVAGVQPGDIVYVVHEKADGSIEVVPAKVLANGVIEFTLSSFSPISIVRVAPATAAAAPVMPKTGDNTSAVPMVMLLAACAIALAVCGKALKVK